MIKVTNVTNVTATVERFEENYDRLTASQRGGVDE